MPRARNRKTSTSKTSSRKSTSRKKAANAQSGSFVCPECGRTFSRAAALGAHRRRAHGVIGTSAQAQARTRRAASTQTASRSAGGRPRAAAAGGGRDGGVDRDALLRALFPKGIPARESVIRELEAWLDQGERLARRG